ncbi:serine/threonine-protein kinase [Planctomicrobium sp. SH664]|uniref:serine/threonine-protein kinase n=1 Tax=Planctomicrobium sp. SH664 TaxID=3448125 RepID=UPI003F5B4E15
MVPQSADELARLLVDLQLVSLNDMRLCRQEANGHQSADGLLQLLERKQLLTSLQVQRLQKGEIEGLILGGCKLLYRNAAGSFARVYRAEQIKTGQMIGVKVLRERWSSDPDTIQLFHREGEIGRRLKHPNIVPIFDVGVEGKIHYMTMEFVEGGNLRDFIKIRTKVEPAEACQFALDISRGLAAALAQGVTHRDMKTTNVLMSSNRVAKLIDFGLAADDSFLNRVGSPDLAQALEYSTLEKNTDAPRNDPRSDLFFLGTILYELLCGEPPYPRTRDREERKRFSRYRDIRPVTTREPRLPGRIVGIVEQLLQINPAQRYQSPGEVAAELEGALRELGHVPNTAAGTPPPATNTKTLICVENRPKRQDILRDYFSKHGFRVLLLGDADRAISRLKSMSPQAIIFFADCIGDRIVGDVQVALQASRGQDLAVVTVLGENQSELLPRFDQSDSRSIVLRQPINLRELRKSLERDA